MKHQALKQAARAAFSGEDWLLVMSDALLARRFSQLSTIEEVEDFIFESYDRLRSVREKHAPLGGVNHRCSVSQL
jgi:hypothetical protein